MLEVVLAGAPWLSLLLISLLMGSAVVALASLLNEIYSRKAVKQLRRQRRVALSIGQYSDVGRVPVALGSAGVATPRRAAALHAFPSSPSMVLVPLSDDRLPCRPADDEAGDDALFTTISFSGGHQLAEGGGGVKAGSGRNVLFSSDRGGDALFPAHIPPWRPRQQQDRQPAAAYEPFSIATPNFHVQY